MTARAARTGRPVSFAHKGKSRISRTFPEQSVCWGRTYSCTKVLLQPETGHGSSYARPGRPRILAFLHL
jgi:hypothetical protein